MKRVLIILLTLLIISSLVSCGHKDPPDKSLSPMDSSADCPAGGSYSDPAAEVRGIYIATVYNLDFPSKPGLSADALKSELNEIVTNTVSLGCNAIYFQVRGASDAMYDSSIFPISEYLTGKADGELPEGFDPLTYLVEKAHANGVSVHAWINPLRVTRGGSVNKPKTDTDALPEKSPARKDPGSTVAYAGELYYNAGLPEVRELVAKGVGEIVENYDVDGVLFDDYFYPYPEEGCDFDDADSYAKYGGGLEIGDWRRENINRMVRACYDTIKAIDPDCRFGIAPFGIWQNDDGNNGGSATRGLEAYESIFCDALAWAKGGYVDYIAPQIYWSFSHKSAPYAVLADWWNAELDGTGVELYVSHAAYKYGTDDWSFAGTVKEMREQLRYARNLISYRGSILYGYSELSTDTDGVAEEVSEAYCDEVYYTTPIPTGAGVEIIQPLPRTVAASAEVMLHGTSAPETPVTYNGRNVSRRRGGEFYLTVTLHDGENRLTFVSGGKEYSYTLFLGEEASAHNVQGEIKRNKLASDLQ